MYSKRALTRGDIDGAIPDYGVALGEDNILIGMAVFGGNGSNAGFFNSGDAVPAEIWSTDSEEGTAVLSRIRKMVLERLRPHRGWRAFTTPARAAKKSDFAERTHRAR